MDFDTLPKDYNPALYPKLFEETLYTPQMDHNEATNFNSSLSQLYNPSKVLGNLDHNLIMEGSLSSNPFSIFGSSFYDPFDPFQAPFGKLNQEFSTPFAQDGAPLLHGSQSKRFLEVDSSRSSFQTMDQYNLDCPKMSSELVEAKQGTSDHHQTMNIAKNKMITKRKRIVDKKSDIVKGQWTPEEDGLLMKLVEKHGVRKWSTIAQMLPGRIGKQCRERWHNHLKPNIKKDRWSEEEDRILIEAHRQLGNKWAEIARRLPGRSENTIKNHWNATKRRQLSSRKTKNSKINTPLQNYIKSVILTSDHNEKCYADISSSGSTSPTDNIAMEKSKKICLNMIKDENDHSVEESYKFLDAQMHIQSDLQKEMDFMEMISYGYI
ncbi:Transcription factor, Myb superfamily [Handroanthus impetiginosus]|uniref:Transcription factor, Myb superfamily n=1 Tax=Handroanthus impetiginosus TaxID=429701 RepID=A0A2G9HWG5_9LAMI|nr:Transcription factor, Myb superfamily [Handroanthus impetiginosus]